MHILLTDVIACPRCGPDFGLIVLADEIEERRVRTGRLGCPNCRHGYEVSEWVADLRHDASPALELEPRGPEERGVDRDAGMAVDGRAGVDVDADPAAGVDPADRAYRTAALMGVQGTNATLLVVGGGGETAAGVAGLLPDTHVVGLTSGRDGSAPDESATEPAAGTLSRVLSGNRLPFRSASVGAVAALGSPSPALTRELIRVLRPGGRIVVETSPPELVDALLGAGLEVLLQQDGMTVAAGPGAR